MQTITLTATTVAMAMYVFIASLVIFPTIILCPNKKLEISDFREVFGGFRECIGTVLYDHGEIPD